MDTLAGGGKIIPTDTGPRFNALREAAMQRGPRKKRESALPEGATATSIDAAAVSQSSSPA